MKTLLFVIVVLFYQAAVSAEEELIVKTIKEAKECKKQAENGDKLRVFYVGRFDNENGEIFDQSRDGNTYDFILGTGQVIQGYEQGMPGVCEGETRTLTCPPHLAYGEQGYPGIIPGGATLHFTVEVVEIVKSNDRARGEREEM